MNTLYKRLEQIEKRNQPKPEGAYIAIIAENGTVSVTGRGSRLEFADRQAFNQWQAEQKFTNDLALLIVDAARNRMEPDPL